jgi:sterol desaturase/sphingolipid hydroxylase (fatty acid hydroxylase superfamily)
MNELASVTSYLVVALSSLAVLGLIFVPLERTFPARAQLTFRPLWSMDVAFFLGQHLVWTGAVLTFMASLSAAWHAIAPAVLFASFARLALWQQALTVLLLGDVLLYWGHRLQHRVPLLWRFHRVHHTARHLDWLAAYREHPLDGLYTRTLVNLPAVLLGFPLEAIAGVFVFRGLWAVFIHSNVLLTPGPFKYVFGSPHLHRWHHALTDGVGSNFANLFPALDVLFGTYYEPASSPDAMGAHGPAVETYLGHLARPLIPQQTHHESPVVVLPADLQSVGSRAEP